MKNRQKKRLIDTQQILMILWGRAEISRTVKSKAVHSCRKLSRCQKTDTMAGEVHKSVDKKGT